LPFSIQTQLESNWCWAAVAVSIYDFFAPGSGTWTQNALATTLLKQQGHKSANCEEHPSGHVCNRPEPLDAALKITGNLRDKGAHFNQYLSFECIQNWISAQLPLGARIVWRGGGAHFIAFDGYKVTTSGRKLVHVGDPASNANAGPGFHDYEHVVEDYEQAGYWNDTYLVSPNL
jgi:hypothetical protein